MTSMERVAVLSSALAQLEAIRSIVALELGTALQDAAREGAAGLAAKLEGGSSASTACSHPADRRRDISTMGGGARRELCACGMTLENGVPMAAERSSE